MHSYAFIPFLAFVRELPATCEVTDEDVQDEFLCAGYINLLPLRCEQETYHQYAMVAHLFSARGPFFLGTQLKVLVIPCSRCTGWQ